MASLINTFFFTCHKNVVSFHEHGDYKFDMIRRFRICCKSKSVTLEEVDNEVMVKKDDGKRLRILIAGGGIEGLVLALAAKNRGFDVKVFEKDLSAVRGEGPHRGPIQLSSNALAALRAIDDDVTTRIREEGYITGNKVNGVADGVSGKWFAKYDLQTPAVKRGFPLTQVICRMELQQILLHGIGNGIVINNSKEVSFVEDSSKVIVILDDGRQFEGDVLVGADGIWSEVRTKLFGATEATYSNYITCYSGKTEFVPSNMDYIGYCVFLGVNQYFVASSIGNDEMHFISSHPRAWILPQVERIGYFNYLEAGVVK